jgi:hypothetical protein
MTRLRLVRYGGLTGSVLLAVAAYLGGVFPGWTADVTPLSIWRGEGGPLLLLAWLAGTGLLVGGWWALRAGTPSVRWAYLTAGLWLAPLLVAPPLGSRDVYSYACQGAVYAAGADPYSDGVAALNCPWLDAVAPIWRDSPAPYGPLFVLLAGLAAGLGGSLVGTVAVLRLFAVLGVLIAAACLPGLARRAGVPPERAAWLVLGCPVVAVHLVAGAHNDAVMVGLLLASLLVVTSWPGLGWALLAGGALLGLAAAVKVTALVVLPFAALAATVVPSAGPNRVPALLRGGAWTIGGALAAMLAVAGISGLGVGWLGGLAHSGDSAQWTSVPTALGFTVDYLGRMAGVDIDAVPVTRLLGLLALAGFLAALWWSTWRRATASTETGPMVDGPASVDPAPARIRALLLGAGLALAATVALAPVFHPWYATWPLAVLAVAAVRTAWFLVPCGIASVLTLPDGTNLARFTKAPGAIGVTVLVGVLAVWLIRRRKARLPDSV